jgi:hypothetical protein
MMPLQAWRSGPVRRNLLISQFPQSLRTSFSMLHSRAGEPERNLALVDALRFAVIEFDKEDARQAGKIRAFLTSKGTPISPYDVLIAGQRATWSWLQGIPTIRAYPRAAAGRLATITLVERFRLVTGPIPW